jgi:DNA-binding NarL/FixJ family response regulator
VGEITRKHYSEAFKVSLSLIKISVLIVPMKRALLRDRKSLLLVTEDLDLLLLIKDHLEFQGYSIVTAQNSCAALALLQKERPDLIICDEIKSEGNNNHFIETIRQDPRTEAIPLILLGKPPLNSPETLKLPFKLPFKLGTNIFRVEKPVEAELLIAQVESSFNPTAACPRPQAHCSPHLEALIHKVPSKVELTPTEIKVVELVAQGMSNKKIAETLKVSQRTVESHVSNMLHKTTLHNRTELARWAIASNIA